METHKLLEDYHDIQLIAEELVKACGRKRVMMTGFIYSVEPPFIMHIGTVKEKGPELTAVHVRLCDIMADGHAVLIKKL